MSENTKTSLVKKNNIYILGGFNREMIENVIVPLKDLIDLLKEKKDKKITFYINSNGGMVDICLPLVDLIEEAKKEEIIVETIVSRTAYSAGSVLAITGTKGYRFMQERAEHLIHYGEFGANTLCTPKQIDRASEFWKRYVKSVINHYKKYSNVPDLEKKN